MFSFTLKATNISLKDISFFRLLGQQTHSKQKRTVLLGEIPRTQQFKFNIAVNGYRII
jgi:hypothetical protein